MRRLLVIPLLLAIATIVALVVRDYPGEPIGNAPRFEKESDGPPPRELMEARFGGEQLKARRRPTAPLAPSIATANWQELGPLNMTDPGSPSAYEPSQGRINAFAGDAKNPQHLYAAGASGGVWVTNNGGTTWAPRAQTLPIITVSSIVVDQNDGNIVYVATGDADGFVTPSIGVYKSTDGGTTWSATGLTFPINAFKYITKLAIDPTNGANVYAATSDGVYRTQNGGTNWTQVQPSGTPLGYRDIKLRPGTVTTIYAVADSGAFFRSVDSGANWQPATGVPNPATTRRAVLGVTAADANAVYLLGAQSGPDDLVIYKSNDGGGTFAQVPSATLTSFAAGQATFYDLVLAVSPTNANELMAGVVGAMHSTDGGATWVYTSSGPAGAANPIVHVDQHAMEYFNNAVYDGSDGGLHRSTDGGQSWANLSPTLGVGQIYQLSGSRQNPSLIFVGEQDNGFNRYLSGKWEHFNVGDFGRLAVDPTNDQVIYASCNYAFFKYTDITKAPTELQVTTEGKRFEGAPVVINPTNTQIVYAGYQNLFRTTNGGGAWQNITNFAPDGMNVDVIVLAPSDPKIIYLARSNGFGNSKVYRSPDGTTFNDISAGLPAVVTGIAVDPTNPNRVWASLQGGTTNAVYSSQNGGANWTNYSGTSLPNSSTRSIVYETGSQDGIYVGTVAGVYFRDSTMADWQAYNTNLPNVVVNSLEIDYNSRKLRAGTYGRGAWQTDLATRSTAAKAQLLNISTRLPVSTGTNVSIAGFIVTGTDAKKVIVRGMGPSLPVTGKLNDPTLELHDATKTLLTNDNWKDTQEAEIRASTIPPTLDAESAIVATVPGNNANYTTVLAGKGGGTGTGLVEVYDLAQTANSRLANISTRGFVGTGDENVMIGGLILGPSGVGTTRIVFRAIGPSLTNFGIPDALNDPTLDLRNSNGASLAVNDNWKDTQQAEILAAGLAPANEAESAILQDLAPGNYTAIVRGKGAATGTALVEAYNIQ